MQEVRLAEDHLRPAKFEYKGIMLRIRFSYPQGSDVPSGATITIDGAPKLLDALELNEPTYEAALSVAQQAAKDWIDNKPSA